MTVSTAAGVISLLQEKNPKVVDHCVQVLTQNVNVEWPEISEHLSLMYHRLSPSLVTLTWCVWRSEELFEAGKGKQIALLLSKVYFHLGDFSQSVEYALASQDLFYGLMSAPVKDEYTLTVIQKAIEFYIQDEAKASALLKQLVERIFNDALPTCALHTQLVGIALESKRLDLIQILYQKSTDKQSLLTYCLSCVPAISDIAFRHKVWSSEAHQLANRKTLYLLAELFKSLPQPDHLAIAKCCIYLNDSAAIHSLIQTLLASKNLLVAYQVCFDIFSFATQSFISSLIALLKADALNENVLLILSGQLSIKLQLEFLFRGNNTDSLILSGILNALDSKSSIYHAALSICHGFMNAGTTNDSFLRDNMEWLGRANNWTKFTAVSQLGVVHKGNVANSMNILSPYLPQEATSVTSSFYTEGGALFALGLIHANHGGSAVTYLLSKLSSPNEIIQHGASLGLGSAALATCDEAVYEGLKKVMFMDGAVGGEGAGMGMGLVMAGSGNAKCIAEMREYAKDTQHEKIVRGLALGIAIINYRLQEEADASIALLLADKDANVRFAGVYTIAMAYVCTSKNNAIKLLLSVAVGDANDDVRRAAVGALGFVMSGNEGGALVRVVGLLSESYSPSVRYGSAMALGVGCAGTGCKEALDLLEPLSKDPSDFVRQGAFVAAAMILVQQNDLNPRAVAYRQLYSKVINAKHEDPLAKFGAIISSGIIDAGGRNVTIALSRDGHVKMEAVVGLAIFLQFWSWFPMSHFLSLAFTPTCLIGLDVDLKMPKLEVVCASKPSVFAYPKKTEPVVDEKVEKIATVVLSTTNKVKARAAKKEGGDAMETDVKSPVIKDEEMKSPGLEPSPTPTTATPPAAAAAVPEPTSEILPNMSRVLPAQVPLLSFKAGGRYAAVKKGGALGGILMLNDLKPDEPKDYIEFSTPAVVVGSAAAGAAEEEVAAPEPFEYIE